MLGFPLGLFRLVWLFGKGHQAVALENLALRQQLSVYKRKQKLPRLIGRDRWFWIALSVVWKEWRRALCIVHPDTVVHWQRERFRRYWAQRSNRSGRTGRPAVSSQIQDQDPGPASPSLASVSMRICSRIANSLAAGKPGGKQYRHHEKTHPDPGTHWQTVALQWIPNGCVLIPSDRSPAATG